MADVKPGRCSLCGEMMPRGEEMFKFHGYTGDCPKPPLPQESPQSPDPRDERIAELKEALDVYAYKYGREIEKCDQLQADNARLADGGARWAQNAEHFRKEAERLRSYLERMDCSRRAVPARDDRFPGALQWEHSPTCLRCQALEAHGPVTNADAPAPADMSASCSESAGTEPSCAPSHHNLPGISCTPEQVRRLEDVAVEAQTLCEGSLIDVNGKVRTDAFQRRDRLAEALAALRDSGWRG